MRFKVGDKVKVIKAPKILDDLIGMTGTVERITGYYLDECVFVDFGFESPPELFFPEELVDIE